MMSPQVDAVRETARATMGVKALKLRDDDELARPRQHDDAHAADHERLSGCDPAVAWSDDDVDRREPLEASAVAGRV